MRIEELRFSNINSLKGGWHIDFTGPEYCGLFAITGPTGAGKSSILDAIGLSLYGRTPRLSGINQSSNEVMTRGTSECMAQTTFSAGGVRYRSTWEQHRARRGKSKGASGKLQPQTVRLEKFLADAPEESCWEPLATSINEFNRRIEQVTGLTYEQFCRSVLLAQGDFAAFLQSTDDSRAQILEQITGTHVYSDISIEVQRLYREHESGVRVLEARLAEEPPLSAEEREQLEHRQKELAAKAAEAKAMQADCSGLVAWVKEIARLERESAEASLAIEKLGAKESEMAALSEKLAAADRARSALPAHETRKLLRQTAERAQKALADAHEKLVKARTANEQAAQAKDSAEQAAASERKRHAGLLELLKSVRSLDKDVQAAASAHDSALKGFKESEHKLRVARKKLQGTENEIRTLTDQSASTHAWLERHASDGALEPLAGEITETRTLLLRAKEDSAAAAQAEKRAALSLSQSEQALEKAVREKKAFDERSARLQAEEKRAAGALQVLLAGKTLEEHEALRRAADLRLQAIHAADRTRKDLHEAQKQLSENQAGAKALERGIASAEQSVKDARAIVEALSSAENTLISLTRVMSLAEERLALRPGTPCPLCGALEHPFSDHLPEGARNAKDKLGQTREQLRAARGQLSRAEQSFSKKTGLMEQLAKSLADSEARCGELSNALVRALSELRLQQAAQLDDERSRTEQSFGAVNHIIETGSKARQEMETIRSQLQKHHQDGAAVLQKEAAALSHRDDAQTAHREAVRSLSEASGRLDALVRSIHDRFAPCFSQMPSPLEALDDLIQRSRAFQDNRRRSEAYAAGIASLAAARTEQEIAAKDAELAEEQARAACQSARAALESRTQERRSLFADRIPDIEEDRSKSRLDAAEAALESADKAARVQGELFISCEAGQRQAEEQLAQSRTELERAERAWTEALSASGFADDAAWQSALMSEPSVKQARETLRNYGEALHSARERKSSAEMKAELLRAERRTERSLAECEDDLRKASEAIEEINQSIGSARKLIEADDGKRLRLSDKLKAVDEARHELAHWTHLNSLIGSADGSRFRRFVQSLTLERLIALANSALKDFSGRYILVRSDDEKQPLSIDVIDTDLSGERRSSRNLSGGETFIVSLALALGLSRLASRNVTIESLFLDEGFGTLDEDSLERALQTLSRLVDGRHLVGLISHVGKIEERIPTRIAVTKHPGGVSTLSGPGVQAMA